MVRTHTSAHPVQSARSYMIFKLDATGGCNYYWLSPYERMEAAMIVKAKINALPVWIQYDPEVISPWGDANACRTYSIDFR
jgi:hypothetical protein